MATPQYSTVIHQINQYILANANNEITAEVLNPILRIITDFTNNNLGDLSTLNTTVIDNVVGAINSLKSELDTFNSTGVQLYTGYDDPNVTPPNTYNYGDFYMELDINDNTFYQLWQFVGDEWTTLSSVYSKSEIDFLFSNYYTKAEIDALISGLGNFEPVSFVATANGQNQIFTLPSGFKASSVLKSRGELYKGIEWKQVDENLTILVDVKIGNTIYVKS